MSDEETVPLEVRRGAPTAEELAAVIAVVTEAYATERSEATADDRPLTSAWGLSARGMRTPIDPRSVWGRFEG